MTSMLCMTDWWYAGTLQETSQVVSETSLYHDVFSVDLTSGLDFMNDFQERQVKIHKIKSLHDFYVCIWFWGLMLCSHLLYAFTTSQNCF
jgi:hypothetical protein